MCVCVRACPCAFIWHTGVLLKATSKLSIKLEVWLLNAYLGTSLNTLILKKKKKILPLNPNTCENYVSPDHIYTTLITVGPGFLTKKMLLLYTEMMMKY